MDPQSRRAIAYIAARLTIRDRASNSLYDFQQNMHFNFNLSGDIDDEDVSVFDYTSANYLTGKQTGTLSSPKGISLDLIYHATNSRINLHISRDASSDEFIFSGKDKSKVMSFHGTVDTTSGKVSLYDSGAGRYFSLKF